MKKTLLLLASAALLLVGCAKEKFAESIDGGMTNVTFTARVDGGVATKADIDNDGKGTYVNRCIMEIYFQNQLYKRMEAAMSETPATATFANVPVVAGKEYQILFWADCGDELADKYYTTKTEGEGNKGLKAVTVNGTAFKGALEAGKNDELDAFFAAQNYTVSQTGDNAFTIKLHRPFAQLNVITIDVAASKTVTSAELLPEKVSVSYTAATTFNVADSTVTGSATYAYEAPVYGDKTNWETVKTRGEFTLSMDYLLASTEQGAVDVTFITKNGGQSVMTHNLTNLPYQRNYRTNVKGELLTAGGTWTAKIDPIWSNPDIVKVVEVADIKSANEIINQYKETTNHLEVKFVGVPNDSGEPTGEEDSQFRAILTSPLKQDANLGIEVMTNTKTLYVGDYKVEYSVAELAETASLKAATVNINVPQNSGIETLIINAPSKTVLVNGKLVSNVGTITNIDAITSQNTLIIEPGQQVGTLTMRQGGLEIHGTVGTLVIAEEDHDNNPVKVRTSENLSQTVFDVIYKAGEGGQDYIDRPAYSEKKNANGTWDIVPSVCKIGETAYGSLKAAVEAVPEGAQTTITMISNHAIDVKTYGVTIPPNKNIILDLNGKEVAGVCTAEGTSALINNSGTLKVIDSGIQKGKLSFGATPTWAYPGGLDFEGSYASNVITNRGTLFIDGAALVNQSLGTASACYAIDIYDSGTAQVDNGYLKAKGDAVRLFYGNGSAFTFNSGTIEAGARNIMSHYDSNTEHHITINGGTFYTSDTYEWPCNIDSYSYPWLTNNKCTLNITGGTFNKYIMTNFAEVSITGGSFYDFYSYATGSKPVIGGYFENSNYSYFADYIADGYAVVENTDPATSAKYPFTVKVKPVVKIGNVEYADIADAFAAVPANTPTTVTLLENIGSKSGNEIVWKEYAREFAYTVNANQNITFDLNGKKIYAKTTVNGYTGFLLVKNGGSLTIKDSAEGGEINYLDGNNTEGGLAISSEGSLTILSGTIENYTVCDPSAAIQGAIDVHANEWGTPYAHHVTFNMEGGVLKSQTDNTLRIYDSSQTGTGGVVIDFEINGGEIYGADAVFIMPAWIAGPTHVSNDIHMNNINVSVTGGHFDTTNGIRVFGAVNALNDKDYKAIDISVTGGEFIVRGSTKYREGHIAYQNNYASTAEAVPNLVSFTKVTWTADAPTYID